MYAPQGLPAVFFSVLAFHVKMATLGLLSRLGVPALDLCLHLPELLSDTVCKGRRKCRRTTKRSTFV